MQISEAGEKRSELKEALGGLRALSAPSPAPCRPLAAATSLPLLLGGLCPFVSVAPDPAHNPPESFPQGDCDLCYNGCKEVHFQNFILIWSEKMSRPTVHMGLPTASLGGPNWIPQLPSFLVGATAWDPSGTHAQRAGQPLSRETPTAGLGTAGTQEQRPLAPPPPPPRPGFRFEKAARIQLISASSPNSIRWGPPREVAGCVCWGGGRKGLTDCCA